MIYVFLFTLLLGLIFLVYKWIKYREKVGSSEVHPKRYAIRLLFLGFISLTGIYALFSDVILNFLHLSKPPYFEWIAIGLYLIFTIATLIIIRTLKEKDQSSQKTLNAKKNTNSTIIQETENATIVTGSNVDLSQKTKNIDNSGVYIKKQIIPQNPNEQQIPTILTTAIYTRREEDIIGREKDLKKLHTALFDQKQVVLMNGMGGIGKTTLAQLYLGKHKAEYAHIAWITFNGGFRESLVNENGLINSFNLEKQGDLNQIFHSIIHSLRNLIAEKPNLLILDNAIEMDQYSQYLPEQPQWHILATSRQEFESFETQTLGFLSLEDGLILFKKLYTGNDLKEEEIKKIIKEIEYHTLTIEILAKSANRRAYDFEELTNALQQDLKANIKTEHSKGVKVNKITSYLSSIFNASELEKTEIAVLKKLIYLPQGFHSLKLMTKIWHPEKTEEYHDFIDKIKTLTEKGWLLSNPEQTEFQLHHVIREVLFFTQSFKYKNSVPYLIWVTKLLNFNNSEKRNTGFDKIDFLPFAFSLDKVLAYLPKKEENNDTKELATYWNNKGLIIQIIGEFEEAKILLEKAVKSNEKHFGIEHPTTAISYSNLAMVLQDLGEYQNAKELLEKTMKSNEKTFGSEHPSTAISYSNLATVLKDLGEYQNAKKLLEKVVISDEKTFGSEHPSTASSYSNLALVLQNLGEYQNAKELLEKTMKSNEKTFGSEHPSTAISYSNLAIVLKDLGEYQNAKELLEKTVKSNEKTFGSEHPSTTNSYSNLALVLKDLGEYQNAKELLEKAVKSNEKTFGSEHPSTAISYSNLAIVLKDLGEYQNAKELLEKTVKSNEKTFGIAHPSTAIPYFNLATVLKNLNRQTEAMVYFKKAYHILLTKLGENHPNTKTVKKSIDFYDKK